MGLLQKLGQGVGQAMQDVGSAGIEEKRQQRLLVAKDQATLAAEGRAEKRTVAAEGRLEERNIASEGRLEERNIASDERRAIREAANLDTKVKPVSVKSTARVGGEDSTQFLQTMSDGSIYLIDAESGDRTAFEDLKAAKAKIKEDVDAAGVATEWLETLRDEPWSPMDRDFLAKRFGDSDTAATKYITDQIKSGKSFVDVEQDLLSGGPATTPGAEPTAMPSAESMITVGGKKMPLDEFIQSRVGDDAEKKKKLLAKLRGDTRFKSLHSAIDTRLNVATN